MGANGSTTLNFGAFPGKTEVSVAVTGQTGIVAGSLIGAWILPVATSDHSIDEHRVEQVKVTAADISVGVGFTIYGESVEKSARLYGEYTVAWAWT